MEKIYLYRKIIFILLIILIKSNMGLNAKNNGLEFYRYYEEVINSSSSKYPKSSKFISFHFLTLDFKNKRYQINYSLTLNGGDSELIQFISQGYIEINKEEIILVDKNNSIITKGVIKNNSIIFKTGLIQFRGKEFCKMDGVPSDRILLDFSYWENDILLKYNNNNELYKDIRLGTYSVGFRDEEPRGIVLELTQKEYNLYCIDGNRLKYNISSGIWQIKFHTIKLKDYDNLNTFEMYILDDSTIIPSTKLPIADDISPLRLK